MKRTHTILATITLISVILTSACTAGNANSTTSSVPETAVTTTAPAVTGTVMDRIDEPKAETTTAQTTTAVTTKPQETKSAETTTTTTKAVTTAKPKPATTTTAATTKPAPEWTETKASGTKYVNTDCYSRKKAVLGADTVKLYSVNDKVTVIAKTDTGYFKLSDGSFIHSDYLSDNKVAQPAAPATKKTETSKPATTTKKQESKPAEDNWRFTKQDCEDILKACEKYAKDNGYGYCKPSDFDTVKGKVYQHSSWTQVYANSPAVPKFIYEGYTRKEAMIAMLCGNIQLNYDEGLGATCVDYCLASEYYEWLKSEGVKNPETHTACQDLTAYVFFPCY